MGRCTRSLWGSDSVGALLLPSPRRDELLILVDQKKRMKIIEIHKDS